MKLSYNWLKRYVDLEGVAPAELARRLTLATAEIEEVRDDRGGALGDAVFEIDNKSINHRPDLWGHYGFAREIAALYGRKLAALAPPGGAAALAGPPGAAPPAARVEAPELCPRYSLLALAGLAVAPSPPWLARLLEAVGVRPIDNVVDATNFVLLELGQPLHAFDADRLTGGEIVVRRAAAGEALVTLDGKPRRLTPEMLVIADGPRPAALAGVMGGADSEIRPATVRILLESANFDPVNIRRTAAALGLRSESSVRFEKSLDPENALLGLQRAAALIRELCPGARIAAPPADLRARPPAAVRIPLDHAFLERRLGMPLEPARVRAIFAGLGFAVREEPGGAAAVEVPSWRATRDVLTPADLVEEVGRMIGYGAVPPVLPRIDSAPPRAEAHAPYERRARRALAFGQGMTEVYNYSIAAEADLAAAGEGPEGHLRLVNPVAQDRVRLRLSLVPGLLGLIRVNGRQRRDFALFELGRVYFPAPRPGQLPDERRRIAGLFAAPAPGEGLFHRAKGAAEALLEELGVDQAKFVRAPAPLPPWAAAGRTAQARAGERGLGLIAEIAPEVLARVDARFAAAVFELDLAEIMAAPARPDRYRPLPRFPGAGFDLAVVAPEKTESAAVSAAIREAGGEFLEEAELFDVWRGPALPAGRKSLAFRLLFRSPERTLTDAEVASARARIIAALESRGWALRG